MHTPIVVKPALEALFTLSRTSFVLNNSGTYAIARSHLDRAAALLAGLSAGSVSCAVIANYTRCAAGVNHHFASQLYQSGRYDHTIRFLEESCRLGQQALDLYHAAKTTGATDATEGENADKEEVWKQLEEQLSRRWELLGVCQAKTGDRKVRLHYCSPLGRLIMRPAACVRSAPQEHQGVPVRATQLCAAHTQSTPGAALRHQPRA